MIDRQVAFVGGRDLTTFLGDRYDTPKHFLRADLNWPDVQLKIEEGETVAEIVFKIRQRWQATVTKEKPPTQEKDQILPRREPYSEQDWSTPVQLVHTFEH